MGSSMPTEASSSASSYGQYIGQKVSVVTSTQIRYDGTMSALDTKSKTITLSDVHMLGTEQREVAQVVAPTKDVYEYIVFRIGDLQEFKCLDEKSDSENRARQPELHDNAIVSKSSSSDKPQKNRRRRRRKKQNQKGLPLLEPEEFLFIDEHGNTSQLRGRAVPLSHRPSVSAAPIVDNSPVVRLIQNQHGRTVYEVIDQPAVSQNRRQSYRPAPQQYQPRYQQRRPMQQQYRSDPRKEFEREQKQREIAAKVFEQSQDLTKMLHKFVHSKSEVPGEDDQTKSLRSNIQEQWGIQKQQGEEAAKQIYNPTESFFDDISRQTEPVEKKDQQNSKPALGHRPNLKMGPMNNNQNRRQYQQQEPVVIYRSNHYDRPFVLPDSDIYNLNNYRGNYQAGQQQQQQRSRFQNKWRNRHDGNVSTGGQPIQRYYQQKEVDPITSQLANLTESKNEKACEGEMPCTTQASAAVDSVAKDMQELTVSGN